LLPILDRLRSLLFVVSFVRIMSSEKDYEAVVQFYRLICYSSGEAVLGSKVFKLVTNVTCYFKSK